MSVDYRIKICRKIDDECLGICNANQLKSILDSEYSGLINCDSGRNCDKVKFTKDDLLAVASAAFDKIKDLYKTITEKNADYDTFVEVLSIILCVVAAYSLFFCK